jgi:predicted nucleic acid-binding protein
MNGIDFLADTNILIYAMEGHSVVEGIIACSPSISIISEIELLGKKGIALQEATLIRNLLTGVKTIGFTNGIKEIAIALRQQYSIKVPDAIIAATAKYYGLTLITANEDFRKIEDLDIMFLER